MAAKPIKGSETGIKHDSGYTGMGSSFTKIPNKPAAMTPQKKGLVDTIKK